MAGRKPCRGRAVAGSVVGVGALLGRQQGKSAEGAWVIPKELLSICVGALFATDIFAWTTV
jgi:hypothetical protein